MSQHDPSVSLRQMRDHAHEVAELVRGRNRGDLDSDRLLALAIVRLLEIIGEAAARVPGEERARSRATAREMVASEDAVTDGNGSLSRI